MGYMHINNLYKDNRIFLFKECFALEKIHGTSAHISIYHDIDSEDGIKVAFFSGGSDLSDFIKLFDIKNLKKFFKEIDKNDITIFGESYGGKIQKMSDVYGKNKKFVAFDVNIGNSWLNVDSAKEVVDRVGLDFVAYSKINVDIDSLTRERDLPSRQAKKNGIVEDKISEGIIIRPLVETFMRGQRVITKYKHPKFSERFSKKDSTITQNNITNVRRESKDITKEWVTSVRMQHVIDRVRSELQRDPIEKDVRNIIDAMMEDIIREGENEIIITDLTKKMINNKTAGLFFKYVNTGEI